MKALRQTLKGVIGRVGSGYSVAGGYNTAGSYSAPSPAIGYVIAMPAAPFVKIDWGTDPAFVIARTKMHNPAVTPGYVLAVTASNAPLIVAVAAHKLADRSKGAGWYEASLDDAIAAIEAAAAACSDAPSLKSKIATNEERQ